MEGEASLGVNGDPVASCRRLLSYELSPPLSRLAAVKKVLHPHREEGFDPIPKALLFGKAKRSIVLRQLGPAVTQHSLAAEHVE